MNLILGSTSMLGKHISKILPDSISPQYTDLMNLQACRDIFQLHSDSDTVVYNLLGYNGNIGMNIREPADIFYRSTQLNINVLKCSQAFGVKKVINVVSACCYPDTSYEMKEEDLFNGLPNETVECHGFAKRILLEYSRQLNKQYKTNSVCAILTNCYGDFDRFDLNRTKVIGAAVKKICDAKLNGDKTVTFWGTGKPVRELIYAGDAAKCLVELAEKYEDPLNPINISSDNPLSIREMVDIIKDEVNYQGEVVWDLSKPDGQAYRKLNTEKMKKFISHRMTPFRIGIQNTVRYYMETGRYLDR